ncbi:D-alanyl-D-alanine carboxypeptidase family protein [Clostridium pasteurianum]|uniref:D-alanyl-D-alanine carboxypeptidase n=1 Tax=Clostridium pasteurianum BC1 TaxID=86416 RepID=R4KEU7_CLOPA|nr:D-alanyl-D-alanine carboxypeptidase [Clostridium pasteurianum]AGK98135.1 D-alanyl-D-alanine carboxypeptidase [Clostridium pasteurianum BC1]
MKRKIISLILTFAISLSIGSTAFAAENNQPPQLYPKTTAVAIDAETGEVIYEKNLDNKIYPASTTKLLTALLLTETKKPTDLLTYTASAKAQPSASINLDKKPLNIGQQMTVENAMKGLLIYSANDIAYMIADNILGKLDDNVSDTNRDFSVLMNKKIAELGLKSTHFITPNGLHDPNHYTTAYDMSVIAKNAFSNKYILDTVKQKEATITTADGINIPIENRNKLILEKETSLYDKTCIGGKTGYTNEAGKCLIAVFDRGGRKIIGVIMNSGYDSQDTLVFKDMENLVNYSYTINYTNLYTSNSTYKTETVSYKPLKFFGPTKTIQVPLLLKENVKYYKNDINDKEKKLTDNISSLDPWKLKTDTSVGTLTLTERGITKKYNLYAGVSTGDLIKDNKLLYGGVLAGIIAVVAVIIILIFNIINLFSKRGRRKSYYR